MYTTIYQKRDGKFVPVQEYYWWRVETIEELAERGAREGESARIACPGCGREYSRYMIRYNHKCPGTLTALPIERKRYIKLPGVE